MQVTKQRRNILVAVFGVVAIAAILMISNSQSLRAEEKPVDSKESVPVTKVVKANLQQEIELAGEFHPYQEVDIDAKVKGYIKTLSVDIGDHVQKDQVIAQLEIPEAKDDLTKAVAAVERARQHALQSHALATDAKEMYDRLAGVMKERPDLVAQQDIDQAKARADAADAETVADRSAVAEATAHEHELKDMLSYARITAPFDGVVTKVYANLGALIGESSGHGAVSGRSVIHLAQLDRLRLIIKIPESVVPVIHENDLVSVSIPAIHATKQLNISRMSHQLDLGTRTMHVEVDYPNSDNAVTPGLYADVKLPVETRTAVLAIPLEAISSRRDQNAKVLVLRSDGTIDKRAVVLGLVTSTKAEIVSGLSLNEMVVVGAKPEHKNGVTYLPQIIAINK